MKIKSNAFGLPSIPAQSAVAGAVYSRNDRDDLGIENLWLADDEGGLVRLSDGMRIPAAFASGGLKHVPNVEVVVNP
jgi:hypothetical protein